MLKVGDIVESCGTRLKVIAVDGPRVRVACEYAGRLYVYRDWYDESDLRCWRLSVTPRGSEEETMNRKMLDRWAAQLENRKCIADFWEGLLEQGLGETTLNDINIEKAMDLHHGIDQAELERARRELLDTHNVALTDAEGSR